MMEQRYNFASLMMIGVSDMENEIIRKLLKKVFKHLGLKKNDSDQFFKPYDMDELLVPMIKDVINEEEDEKTKLAQELLGEKVSEEKKTSVKDRKQNRMQLDRLPDVIHKRPVRPPNFNESKVRDIYGPKRPQISSEVENKMMKGITRESEGEEDQFSILMKRAAGEDYESSKRQKMRRVIGPSRKTIINDKEINDKDSALQHEQIKAYFDEYDRKYRPKSLLELHQEKKKQRMNNPDYTEHKEFDSNALFSTKIDSKEVFKMMGSASDKLSKRFSAAKFKSSFM